MNEAKDVIIMTGCSGLIGAQIIQRFKHHSCHLIGLDLVAPSFHTPDNFTYIEMDVSSLTRIREVLETIKNRFGTRIASFIHLAAYYSFSGGEWSKYESITIHGTEHLLDNLQSFDVEQFVFSSTMLVHDPQNPPIRINEDSPLLDSWEYPRSKIATEKLIHAKHGKIPFVILRIAGCYDDDCHSIPLANQIQRLYEKQFASHIFPGNISHGTSFLHLEDMAEVIWIVVNKRHELPPDVTLLVGEEETLSYDQLQRQMNQLIRGTNLTTYRVPKWFAKMGAVILNHLPYTHEIFIKPWMIDFADENYSLDLTLIKKMLDWQPEHRLSQTLPIMIKNLQSDPLNWYKINNLIAPKWLKRKEEIPSNAK